MDVQHLELRERRIDKNDKMQNRIRTQMGLFKQHNHCQISLGEGNVCAENVLTQ